ncbi:MAG: hypothetical protein LBD02_02620 [Christensenellaceae bacterium]|jgi:hypothetical protein|nr:hypothetical protein [Christensenellaceae bacterium]
MIRYSKIAGKFPREFLLLQGRGCFHKKCRFCDYHLDVSADPFAVNAPVLAQIMGESGVVDVINSGSAHEIDEKSLALLREMAEKRGVHTLWFEAHYAYGDRLGEIRARFPKQRVKFRTGAESFDPAFRCAMQKGIPAFVTPEMLRERFEGVCLLAGVQGQSRQGIENDILTAARLFEYFSVNLFCPNSTPIQRDAALSRWFIEEMAPLAEALPNCELLIGNTDLGVG